MAGCVVCEKIREKKAHFIYEDDLVVGIMPARPASPGHIKIMPKSHFTKLDEMDDALVEHLFMVANYASASVFDVLKAQGTNMILNEGMEHIAIDVLSRRENDGLNFMWKPKNIEPAEFDSVFSKIKDKAFSVGKKDLGKPAAATVKRSIEVIKVPDEDDGPIPERATGKHSQPQPQQHMNDSGHHAQHHPGSGQHHAGAASREEEPESAEEKKEPPKKKEELSYLVRNLTKIP